MFGVGMFVRLGEVAPKVVVVVLLRARVADSSRKAPVLPSLNVHSSKTRCFEKLARTAADVPKSRSSLHVVRDRAFAQRNPRKPRRASTTTMTPMI